MEYSEFLETKKKSIQQTGFDVHEDALNNNLFPFQKFVVKRALKAGKYALFEDCGLGKTLQQLEWAYQVSKFTNKPVLILAPLAVKAQTIQEAVKFGVNTELIHVNNYDQLDNIDTDVYSGVVLDECFAPDTKIQVWRKEKLHEVYIKDCLIGDKVVNCTGIDTITAIRKKKSDYAIKIKYNGKSVISSPRHPYFTQRGWVAAKEIRRGDAIIATDKAMRILQGQFSDTLFGATKDKVLRDILLCEMANETAGTFSKSPHPANSSEKRQEQISMAKNRSRKSSSGTDTITEPNGKYRNKGEGISYIESDRTQTFRAWGKWSRNDITTAINEGCIIRELDSGICYITGQTSEGLPNVLQSRFSELRENDSDRSGWIEPPCPKGKGHKEGRDDEYFRVESFEVLEQGHNELDKYRDADRTLYFIDLEIEQHPSFTINEGLVHNSSILKNFEGETKKLIIDKFKNTPFKLCCTATPSPNDPMELGNHSEFLNIMSYTEMLAMYFVHDGGETAKWRLKGHATKSFYQFVGSWAIMFNKPQDIGFEMTGYALPKLSFIEHQIKTVNKGNGKLFNDTAVSATNFNQELRNTQEDRIQKVIEIISGLKVESVIIWVKQNEEGDLLRKLLPGSKEVKGSDTNEYKEQTFMDFANGKFQILITKTKIGAMGLNFQNCHNQIWASLDFSFEGLYQGIRRSYRFGQKEEVNIYLITTDTMSNVKQSIDNKQKQFEQMRDEMTDAIIENLHSENQQEKNYNTDAVSNDFYQIKQGDSVQLIKDLPDESIGLSVFSPPFAELYCYSDSIEDMGNSKDYKEFLIQFGFLVKELFRVMMQGRNVAVHCMDLPIQKGKHGHIGLRKFSDMIWNLFEENGFIGHSEIVIWKDPVVEMQRTKALGLLHKQVKKDSTMSRVGIPDKVLIFRKDGERSNPVTNTDLPVDLWQKYASPVWMDIDYGNTLQGFRNGRDDKDEKHICPLQLDTIERIVHLYSNKGDTVFTPFMGIGSEAFQAVKMERKAIGFELKPSYFQVAKKNMKIALEAKNQLTLL